MATYRISIVELKPRPATAAEATIPPTAGTDEVKVFEQVVENMNVQTLVRQINATPRRRKTAGKAAQNG